MYYPSYEDYMRDVFYYNGLSHPNNMYPYSSFNTQNLEEYYPSIYKIVNPVIQKVVSGNNYQFANEDMVNNIVDVVIGITTNNMQNSENTQTNDSRKQNNSNNCQNSNNSYANSNVSSIQENNNSLRDLIKILTIKELVARNNVRRFPFTYTNRNQIDMPQFYMNYGM